MKKKTSILAILPVMFGFFVMGFVDIVGTATNYVKSDFTHLNDTVVNLISLSCFFWFLVLSIPTGILMSKVGRKKTVVISFALHIIAFLIPLLAYDFYTILIAFAFVGMGNTLLQVSLNPLVTNVVSKDKLTGTMTLGQFVKAISSFLGPILASWATGMIFGWKLIFPIYAATSLIALIWLWFTPIEETKENVSNVTFKSTFALFKDKYILAFFIGILVLVGVDVGINTTLPKYLMERCSMNIDDAVTKNSVYFFARTIGAFVGGVMLMKFSDRKFFKYSAILALLGLVAMAFTSNLWAILACVSVFGIGYANLFSIIFSISLKRVPEKANEVSALLIMGVAGGAVLPPILGMISDIFNTQLAAIIAITIAWLYIIWLIKQIQTVKT